MRFKAELSLSNIIVEISVVLVTLKLLNITNSYSYWQAFAPLLVITALGLVLGVMGAIIKWSDRK